MVMASRNSREMHAGSSSAEKVNHPAEAKGNASATMKHLEKAGGAEVPKEKPSSLPVQSRVKKQSISARSSMEIFRIRKSENDDDGKGKQQGGAAAGDAGGSIHTTAGHDERRLSDKVKKAWRGVTGQKNWDPLEQWMIKHSGGTLRDVPAQQQSKEHTDGH
ncbi:hypothetical protein F4861DRAFT_425309 [Xylaria intraflava]|nr:hypothetical protein F4861DRAFT_425309 [Xylaria intraflava]